MIVTLELAPGAVVRDELLQQQLGLGRTPIREALQRLVRDQFVTIIPRRGMYVSSIDVSELSTLYETRAILEWIASTLGRDTYVNLMDQYFPAGKVSGASYPEINRKLTAAEFRDAQLIASDLGLQRLDVRRPHPRLRRRMMLVQA